MQKILASLRANIGYNAWQNSFIRHVINRVYSPIENLLYRFLEWLAAKSLIFSALKFLASHIASLIAFAIVFVSGVPDRFWSNKFIYLIAFGMWILNIYNKDKKRIAFEDLFVVFVLGVILASVLSIHARLSAKYLLNYMAVFMLFAIFINNVNKKELAIIINGITFGTLMVSVFGVLQKHIIGVSINLSQTDISISQELTGRVYSTMGNPNVLGEYFILTLPLIIANFLYSEKKFIKAISAFTVLISLYVLLSTGSRSAWASFALCVIVFVLFYKPRLLPILIMLGLISFFFMPQNIQTRVVSMFNKHDTSLNYRKHIYNCAEIMKDDYQLLGGVGVGNEVFQSAFENYKVKELTKVAHSHNLYLQIAIEMGLMTLIALILYIVKTVLQALANRADDKMQRLVQIACIASIAGFMLMSVADYTWFYLRIVYMFFTTLAILSVSNNKNTRSLS